MSRLQELAEEIAALWERECELDQKALLESDPILRSNIQAEASAVANERAPLHDAIAREPAQNAKECLILALFAADYYAQTAAGSSVRQEAQRHLFQSLIEGLEAAAGVTRHELGLEFLWMSELDGPSRLAVG